MTIRNFSANMPVDNYFYPGERKTNFLSCEILKENHNISHIFMCFVFL